MAEHKKAKMDAVAGAATTTTTSAGTTCTSSTSSPSRPSVLTVPKLSPSKMKMDGKFCTSYKPGYYFGVDNETKKLILIRGDIPAGFTWEQKRYVRKVGGVYTLLPESEPPFEFPMLDDSVMIDQVDIQYEGLVKVVISKLVILAELTLLGCLLRELQLITRLMIRSLRIFPFFP
jgi:hypothetical protein